jgi:flavodoxin
MKIAIIYYSHTGNTKGIAEFLSAYFETAHQVSLFPIQSFKGSLESYDLVLLGCPALGDEGIDAIFMEPFIETIPMVGKRIALFGSYGWGNGEWMLDWAKRLKSVKKARVFAEYLMVKGPLTDESNEYVYAFIEDLERWINREV